MEDMLEKWPLESEEGTFRRYTEVEIERFLKEDELDTKIARKIRSLLERGGL